MNELQLFRTLGIDTIAIAARTHQTEAQVYNAMHAQREAPHKQALEDRQRLMRYLRENRRFGVGR
jgi:hypothetical protein